MKGFVGGLLTTQSSLAPTNVAFQTPRGAGVLLDGASKNQWWSVYDSPNSCQLHSWSQPSLIFPYFWELMGRLVSVVAYYVAISAYVLSSTDCI